MKKVNLKKILVTVAYVIFIIILTIILMIAWALYNEKPPQFFPLNSPIGVYKVTKGCPSAQGWEEVAVASGSAFCIAYKGPGVILDSESGDKHFFSITVGNSKVDLAPYLGKEIKGIKGKFTDSSEQCINGKCVFINGPFIVLDIDDVIE